MDNEQGDLFGAYYSLMYEAAKRQNAPGGRNKYLKTVEVVTDLFNESAKYGSFEEGLAFIKASQDYDLTHLATTPAHRDAILRDIDNINRGEIHYRHLRDQPEIYRDSIAPGFIHRDCTANGTIPMDGMRKALASHLKHIGARQSMMLALEEQKLVAAHWELTRNAIIKYARRQHDLLLKRNHTEEQPS